MKNLKLAVTLKEAKDTLNNWPYNMQSENGQCYLVLDTFDFGRDVNGNTINRYHAYITKGDQVSVENNYTGELLPILTSPHKREQSHRPGHIMAHHWLKEMGYDFSFVSSTQTANKKGLHTNFRTVYKLNNL